MSSMLKTAAAQRKERERALLRALERSRADLGIKEDQEAAARLGRTPKQYYSRKKNPFHGFGFEEAVNTASKMGFTAKEVLDIFGIKEQIFTADQVGALLEAQRKRA